MKIVGPENAETHGEAMVAMGLDRLPRGQRLRTNRERIVFLGDVLAEAAQFPAIAVTRSVSCFRVCAMPVMRVSPASSGAIAASVRKVSEIAWKSPAMPRAGRASGRKWQRSRRRRRPRWRRRDHALGKRDVALQAKVPQARQL